MVSLRVCLLVTLGLLAVLAPSPNGESPGVLADVATADEASPSLLSAQPASIAPAKPQSRMAGGETGLYAAMAGPPASPWAVAAFGALDGVQREFLSVFILVATVLAAMVITGRIRRGDPPIDGDCCSGADVTSVPRNTPTATRGNEN
ncbi:membrane hypothetical protein [Candidatus Defluviicoccus seviourii]|uniref:Uncharacterized protein n=2 Tax=root TaxID=1 RepID=A0A564WER9_9PROT|nr:membrane hypothetical protein [uncultured Defluviicoccus sp.]VUX46781.1 membrane hypothetical protein [Candidatus Defluviicoccus seviourii]